MRKKTPETPARLVAYCRVSTQDQAREGVSLEAQRERLAAYAVAHGVELVGVESDEGISGKVPPAKRPGLSKALWRIQTAEADGLLVLKLDRLSRSTRDVLDLAEDANRIGWRLVSVSENLDSGTATGRFTLTILGALAQLEREQAAERTVFGMEHVARQGRVRSRFTPFGFRIVGGGTEARGAGERPALEEHPEEQGILGRMLELRVQGLGARRIARTLNEGGAGNPRTGQPWHPATVQSILASAEKRRAILR